MENIGKFLAACEKYGLMKTDLFQTVDLYEAQNMWQVVLCVHALGRKVGVYVCVCVCVSVCVCLTHDNTNVVFVEPLYKKKKTRL